MQRRAKAVLAFEISATTTTDHELGNIEKCLELPLTHVVMMASHAKHLDTLSSRIKKALEEDDMKRVSFLLPNDLAPFLNSYPDDATGVERYTHYFEGGKKGEKLNQLDYIFLSTPLHNAVTSFGFERRGKAEIDKIIENQGVSAVTPFPEVTIGDAGASDHAGVWVELDIP